jgi:hypothetical protein
VAAVAAVVAAALVVAVVAATRLQLGRPLPSLLNSRYDNDGGGDDCKDGGDDCKDEAGARCCYDTRK